MHTKSINSGRLNALSLLIAFMPISYALGSLILSLNTVIIIIYGFYIFKFEMFIIQNKVFRYLIYFFFVYLITITLINNLKYLNENDLYGNHVLKSFFYLRFLLLFLIVNKIAEKGFLNVRYIYLSSAFMTLFLSLDVILQFYTTKDIFGITSSDPNRFAGFFGNEFIAGGYLQIFSFFLIFFSILFSKNKKIFMIVFFISVVLLLVSIAFTGNRMPFILFLICLFSFGLLEKRLRKANIIILTIVIVSISYLINTDRSHFSNYEKVIHVRDLIKNFYANSHDILVNSKILFSGEMKSEVNSAHLKTFYAGVDLWKENKLLGSGLKSFRINCKFDFNKQCNTHPHNYYIELLLDVGLIGTIIMSLIFILPLWKFIKINYLIHSKNFYERLLVMPFFLIVFAYAFPIKSSGSFFTTSVSTFIFLFLGVLINSEKVKLNKL